MKIWWQFYEIRKFASQCCELDLQISAYHSADHNHARTTQNLQRTQEIFGEENWKFERSSDTMKFRVDQCHSEKSKAVVHVRFYLNLTSVSSVYGLTNSKNLGVLEIQGSTLNPRVATQYWCLIFWTCSGVTILLSLTVFLNLVAESMPTTSDAVPLIGTYDCQPMVTRIWQACFYIHCLCTYIRMCIYIYPWNAEGALQYIIRR